MSRTTEPRTWQCREFRYREPQIDSIFQTPFRSRNIVAERKMGKSSFLELLAAPGTYSAAVGRLQMRYPVFCPITDAGRGGYLRIQPIRVDMVKCRTPTLFFCQVLEGLMRELGDDIIAPLATALNSSVSSISAITTRLVQQDNSRLAYMLTDQQLRRMKSELQIYPMILIDRFDAVLDASDFRNPDFFEYLAAWEEEFTLIIASIQTVLGIRETVRASSEHPWRASSNLGKSFGPEIHLPPFTGDQTLSYVSEVLAESADATLTDSDCCWITETSGGIPYFAARLFYLYLDASSKVSGIEAQRLAQARLLEEEGDRLFAGYWSRLKKQLDAVDPVLAVALRTEPGCVEVNQELGAVALTRKRTSLLQRTGHKIALFPPPFRKFVLAHEAEQDLDRMAESIINCFNDCAKRRARGNKVLCQLDPSQAQQRLRSIREKILLIEHQLEGSSEPSLLMSRFDIEDLSLIGAILKRYFEATDSIFLDAMRKELSRAIDEWPEELAKPCHFLRVYASGAGRSSGTSYDDEKRGDLAKDLL